MLKLIKKSDDDSKNGELMPLQMVRVQGGSLLLGNRDRLDGDVDERSYNSQHNDPHKVLLKSFKMAKYLVTQELYEAVMGTKSSIFIGQLKPVDSVDWYNAVEFCNKLSERENLTPCYKIDKENKDPGNQNEYDVLKWTVTCNFDADGYRLPTSSEWEYAARGGQLTHGYEYAGSNDIKKVGWYCENSKRETHEVGMKMPNELGLFDMSGNLCEWCWDWYSMEIPKTTKLENVKTGKYRVVRGGDYLTYAGFSRVSALCSMGPYVPDLPNKYFTAGFRLAQSVKSRKKRVENEKNNN